jgi:hypothetical protein
MFAHHTAPFDVRSENITVVQNQFVATINMKHEDEGGKSQKCNTLFIYKHQN